MIQWIALGLFLYILSKIWGILGPILKMSQTIKNNQQKTEVHKKIKKMDILDAEFEEYKE